MPDRRFPILDFDANHFSGFFGNQADDLEVRLLSGGACNSNYLVRTPKGERFVCRIHARGNPHVEKFVVGLLDDSIPTPECLWIGDEVSVMTFIEGAHFQPTSNLVQEAGRIIGRLNQISLSQFGQISPDGKVTSFDDWESFEAGLLGHLDKTSVRNYLEIDSIDALRTLLKKHRELLQSFDACHNLVHSDFRPDNILTANDSIVGVLDWEFAHSGCSYMDIGNILRHIPSKWEQDLTLGLKDEGFELPENWRFRSLLIDLCSHLEFLTSKRSENFKRTCVDRINSLIAISTEQ